MLFRYEIKKILLKKSVYIMFLFLIISTLISMCSVGCFGHEFNVSMDAFSCKNNKLVTGSEAYEYNKLLATSYKGVVNSSLLSELHNKYKLDPHIDSDGTSYYDSTYTYFKKIFKINEDNFLDSVDVYRCKSVKYGFSGDWMNLAEILNQFFWVFFIMTILIVSFVFTMDHENDMTDLLGTTIIGKTNSFLRCKLNVVIVFTNCILFIFLLLILGIHFFKYGFDNYDVSIQCNIKYVHSMLELNFGNLILFKIIAGILGTNLIALLTFYISMHSTDTFICFVTSILTIEVFNREILLQLLRINIFDYVLALAPINSYKMAIISFVPSLKYIYIVDFAYLLIAGGLLYMIKKYWNSGKYFLLRR